MCVWELRSLQRLCVCVSLCVYTRTGPYKGCVCRQCWSLQRLAMPWLPGARIAGGLSELPAGGARH